MHTPEAAKADREKVASSPFLLKMLMVTVPAGVHLCGCCHDPLALGSGTFYWAQHQPMPMPASLLHPRAERYHWPAWH